MTNTEIVAFLTRNRAAKAAALIEILTKEDAAATLGAALQLLPGDDRERIVEALVPHSELTVVRDALAIHAPNWGGAAGREMGRRVTLAENIRAIRQDLASAYGGYSQYGSPEIACAINGHLNNGSLYGGDDDIDGLFWEAARQEEEQWPDLDAKAIHREIVEAFAARRAACAAAATEA